jgi:hypothetical protein
MVLTMFHSPVRFGAVETVGAAVGGSDLPGTVFVELVSGVAGEIFDVLPSVPECQFFI